MQTWETQPRTGAMPHGNLDLAAELFTSGSAITKALYCLKNIGVACMSQRTYLKIFYYLVNK